MISTRGWRVSLQEHYDRKYAIAQPHRVELRDRPRDRHEMLAAVARERPGERYLEIGAGAGGVLLAVTPFFRELVATELSPVRAAALTETCAAHPQIRVLCHDIDSQPLPFEPRSFDTIALSGVIEHLIDPIRALASLCELLRPSGRLLIETPNIAKWTRRVKLALGYFPSTASRAEGLVAWDGVTPTELYDEGHFHYFTFRSLRRVCLERAGFSHVEARGYGVHPLARRWPALFSDVFVVATR
jgi:SAM-dependent methyltransferase